MVGSFALPKVDSEMPVSDGRPMSAPSALVRPPGALPLLTRHGADLVHHFYSPHEAERRLPAPHLPHRHGDAERLLARRYALHTVPELKRHHATLNSNTQHMLLSVAISLGDVPPTFRLLSDGRSLARAIMFAPRWMNGRVHVVCRARTRLLRLWQRQA